MTKALTNSDWVSSENDSSYISKSEVHVAIGVTLDSFSNYNQAYMQTE